MSTRNGKEMLAAKAVTPPYMDWNMEEVADWIQSLGFPQYKVNPVLV